MNKYAVIGSDVTNSKSPFIFKNFFDFYKIDACYEFVNASNEELECFVGDSRDVYLGYNVTTPHKNTIMKYLDRIENCAKNANAVNVVKNINGKLVGYNSDTYGVKLSLKSFNITHFKNVIILGNGGVTGAVINALSDCFFTEQIYVVTNHLATEFYKNVRYIKDEEIENYIDKVSLIVNCRKPNDAINYIKDHDCAYFDVNYYESEFSKLFFNNKKFSNGKYMLLYQALEAFKIWFGYLPDLDQIGIKWYD